MILPTDHSRPVSWTNAPHDCGCPAARASGSACEGVLGGLSRNRRSSHAERRQNASNKIAGAAPGLPERCVKPVSAELSDSADLLDAFQVLSQRPHLFEDREDHAR